jgi:hypothetical protein
MWNLDAHPSCIYESKDLYIVKRALHYYKVKDRIAPVYN